MTLVNAGQRPINVHRIKEEEGKKEQSGVTDTYGEHGGERQYAPVCVSVCVCVCVCFRTIRLSP